MDERTLFDQFHEALDVEPSPGAYERMRFAFTNQPVALKRRPTTFRMRWSKMGLRVVTVLAAAAIAIAMGAAILAVHHGPVGSVPAGQDPNVKAYQSMISSNYDALANLDSLGCNTATITDAGCETYVNAAVPVLQKWVSDLTSFKTPTRFAVFDGMLRRHLNDEITELKAVVAYQKTNNVQGFALAHIGQFYEREWVHPAVSTIEGSYLRVAGSYHDALSLANQSLNGCVTGKPGPGGIACAQLSHQLCDAIGDQACANDAHASGAQIQTFLIGLLQNPAPSTLAAKDRQLQADLAQVDTYLLAITDAVRSGNSATVSSAEASYAIAISAADADISAMIGTA